MEYLERLGLVPRKSKKVRETSPQPRRCAEESRGLEIDLTRIIGTDTACATSEATGSLTALKPAHAQAGLIDIARLPIPTSSTATTTTTTTITACFYPRPRSTATATTHEPFIDIDYLEYEQHVQAQARRAQSLPTNTTTNNNIDHFGSPFGSRFSAPGVAHAWKRLIFWKRRRTATGIAASFASASSTPAGSHRTPNRNGVSRHEKRQQVSRCSSSPAGIPLYYCCSDDNFDEPSSVMMRAWYEPVGRKGRMAGLLQDSDEFCNRSPYVALAGAGGRRTLRGVASPGPLYLV